MELNNGQSRTSPPFQYFSITSSLTGCSFSSFYVNCGRAHLRFEVKGIWVYLIRNLKEYLFFELNRCLFQHYEFPKVFFLRKYFPKVAVYWSHIDSCFSSFRMGRMKIGTACCLTILYCPSWRESTQLLLQGQVSCPHCGNTCHGCSASWRLTSKIFLPTPDGLQVCGLFVSKKKLRAASLSGLAHKTICSSSVSKFLQIGFKFPM